MPLQVEIKNLREVLDYTEALPERLADGAKKIFQDAVFAADSEVKDNLKTVLNVRTGALRRSIGTSVTGMEIADLRASIYSGSRAGGQEVVYAPIHEYGGTVNAKQAYAGVPGGPYLNIPTRANQTAAGVTRIQAREVFQRGGVVRKSGPRHWGVFMGDEKMFHLVKSVRIPARLGMGEAVENQVPTVLSRLAELGG